MLSIDYYKHFLELIANQNTRYVYENRLKVYMKYHKYSDASQLVENKDRKQIETEIIEFLIWLKTDRKLIPGSRYNYLVVLSFFYNQVAEIPINSKKISRVIGNDDSEEESEDRGYTREEIAQLLTVCDLRLRMAVLIMSSSGVRLGALPIFRLGHLTRIDNLYKLKVYATNKKDRYYTFCTPECAQAIDSYLDYRKRSGERITDKSPLFRKDFDRLDDFQVANDTSPITAGAIKRQMSLALYKSGLRQPVEAGKKPKRPVSMNHGFRKYFDTCLMNCDVNHDFKELMMGHSVGLDNVYYDDENQISRDKVLYEYSKAIDMLTINEENRLKKQVVELKTRNSEMDLLREEINKIKAFVTKP